LTAVSSTATPGQSTDAPPYHHRATMLVRSLSLFGIMPGMVVAVVVAVLVAPLFGLLALVVVAGAWAGYVHLRARSSLDRVLSTVGATRFDPDRSPRWANVVDGLGVTSGVAEVELWRCEGPAANALAAAGPGRSVVVVTDALVEQLPVVELEGVAANLLGRIKDGSAHYATLTFGLLGGFLASIDSADRLVADGLGEQRAVHSDYTAVGITRYPPGLADALEHLEAIGTEIDGVAPATAHLWIAPAVRGDVGVAPPIAETVSQTLGYRAAVLREL